MANANPMPGLFQRLAEAGFDRAYIRKAALPRWWEESVAETPDGYAQTLTLLARGLGLELASLRDENGPVRCRDLGLMQHKLQTGDAGDTLAQAYCIAARAAQIACYATPVPAADLPRSAAEIRATIGKGDKKLVDFEALLDYCWDMGIPILHVSRFPKGTHKIDGLAACIKGRPAIVLSRNNRFSAWLLFILAHELGHIASGHLDEAGMIVEERVDRESRDDLEATANTFAVELLTGKPDIAYKVTRNLTKEELAEGARRASERDGVDPGVVVLNYAWNKGHWTVGQAALALIEPNADAVAAVHTRMRARLDWDRLPPESQQFLKYVTGAEA